MASHKTTEQCLTWLRSMAADRDSLDGINAEMCLNLIREQKAKLQKLGAQFNGVREERDRLRESTKFFAAVCGDEEARKEQETLGVQFVDF